MTNRVIMEPKMSEEQVKYDTDEAVLEALKAEFPQEHLKTLSGKFSYIPEPIVRKRLEDVLGLGWDWEIITEVETTHKNKPAVVVRGRLTLYLPSGRAVVREAHGGSALDNGYRPGDAHKSAGSNALKKAAYSIGIGAYLGLDNAEGIDDTTSWGTNQNSGTGGGWNQTQPANTNQVQPAAGSWNTAPTSAPIATTPPNTGGGGGWTS